MGRVLTNDVAIAFAWEQTLGVLPGSPAWKQVEPNAIPGWGAMMSTVARQPISTSRQQRKGTITGVDSKVELDLDLTMDHWIDFIDAFIMSSYKGPTNPVFLPTAVTATGFTVPANGALTQNTLIAVRNCTIAGNNGLKVVGASSTGTEIKTSGLTAETGLTNAILEIAGVQGASGDITMTAAGNLASTSLNFTTLGLTVGQFIWIGGETAPTQFAVTANRGWARIRTIAANLLTLDKKSATFTTDAGATKTIQIFFGRFTRNVARSSGDYLLRSATFEANFPTLGSGDTARYEYPAGNYCNEIELRLPLQDKATVGYRFIGTDTPVPTNTRATNAAAAIAPYRVEAFNTSADAMRMRIAKIDETGITTDFKNITLRLKNNVSPEKIIGQIGAKYMNLGNFDVSFEAEAVFTDEAVISAIRNNTTVSLDLAMRNNDGGFYIDMPSATLGEGSKSFPLNESVLISLRGMAFGDPSALNTSASVSLFPYLPAS